ncbi:MAG TPA: ABC transporter permease [Terriglobales bacterium]|nr:ABC transporter permease [Terriglobales bacterium]
MNPLPLGSDPSIRPVGSPPTSMFLRMLVRAAVLRRGRAASALLAMGIASAVATAMMNLYVDVQTKLRKEFRSYGANLVLVGKDGASLPPDALTRVDALLAGRGLAAPFAYIVARTAGGQSVVVAGTDFDRVQKLDRWWSVSAWPSAEHEALVGARALPVVSADGKAFSLSFRGQSLHLNPAATLVTGASEDSRVYLPLAEFEAWTGILPSTIEIAVNGSAGEINTVLRALGEAFPAAEVHAVRQIVEGEARVLGKTRATLYASAALIILTSALCVLATLMGWVFDRRKDFAIMKALGASQHLISGFFVAEAAALGVVGALLGFIAGIGIAAWIGRANFNAPVVPRIGVLPLVVAGSVGVALLSALLPIALLRRVQPALILKGE